MALANYFVSAFVSMMVFILVWFYVDYKLKKFEKAKMRYVRSFLKRNKNPQKYKNLVKI